MAKITIPDEYKTRQKLIAVPSREYREFLIYRKELRDVLRKIERGEAEHKARRTQKVTRLAELDR